MESVSWASFALDMTVGAVAGMVGTVAGQPLDTVKVRLQTSPVSSWSCISSTWRQEGIRGFYRGLASPLISNGPVNAILFGMNRLTLRLLGSDPRFPEEVPMWHHVAAAYMSGTAATLIIVPSELVKCQRQLDHGVFRDMKIWNMLREFQRKDGFLRGPFRGFMVTQARDPPAFVLYFGAYELLRRQLVQRGNFHEAASAMLAGGVAGVLSWLCVYPFDLLKSRIQTAPPGCPPSERKFMPVFRSFVKEYGYPALFRGCGTCCTRAFFANGFVFLTYEYQYKLLRNMGMEAFA